MSSIKRGKAQGAEPAQPPRKDCVFLGSSQEDLRAFPEPVKKDVGVALFVAQMGKKHPDAKVLSGFGSAGVLEVVCPFDGEAYRAVYTVKFGDVLYVLHAFQKKSNKGIATPKSDMDLIESRLAEAKRLHESKSRK